MITYLLVAIYVTASLLLVWLSFRSYRGGLAYLDHFRDRSTASTPDPQQHTAVIVPCKGAEPGLRENLESLLKQDHTAYTVIFVVDDPADLAVATIEQISAEANVVTQLVVAKKATRSSQKIANLLAGVAAAGDADLLVFVDSDARPCGEWLSHLTEPLSSVAVGAATGYRWFISRDGNLASELRAAWNASIASALGSDTTSNFCWGGSMAIRRDVFDRLQIAEAWAVGLSDDFLVTRAIRTAEMQIVFVPQALTPSVGDCTFGELFEFTNRQMKITRVYAPQLWLMSFVGSGLFISVMIASTFIAIFANGSTFVRLYAVVVMMLVLVYSVAKSILRLRAARLVLRDEAPGLDRQARWQHVLILVTPVLFSINSLAALISRKITWRGIKYEMISPTETIIRDEN